MCAELLNIFLLSFLTVLYSVNVSGNVMHDYCRYKFHFYPLPWMDAQKVCQDENRFLVKMDNVSEFDLISSMAVSTIAPMVSSMHTLSTDVWVGLRAQSIGGAMQHQWEDCDHLGQMTTYPWKSSGDASAEGCIAFDTNQKKYVVHDCSTVARPYVCEASTLVSCFDSVSTHPNNAAFTQFYVQDAQVKADINGCIDVCTQPCVVFQYIVDSCTRYTYSTGASTSLNQAREVAYTNAILDHTSYPALSVTAPPPQSSCSNFISPSPSSSQGVSSSLSSTEISSPGYSTSIPPALSSPLSLSSFSIDSVVGVDSTAISSDLSSAMTSFSTTLSSATLLSTPILSSLTRSVTSMLASSAVLTGSACYCPCSQYSNKTYTPEEVQSKIEQIKKELTINVKETNTYQRSLISAPDERVSAKSIGYVGVAILAVVCGLLILIDLPRCIVGCKEFTKKCR